MLENIKFQKKLLFVNFGLIVLPFLFFISKNSEFYSFASIYFYIVTISTIFFFGTFALISYKFSTTKLLQVCIQTLIIFYFLSFTFNDFHSFLRPLTPELFADAIVVFSNYFFNQNQGFIVFTTFFILFLSFVISLFLVIRKKHSEFLLIFILINIAITLTTFIVNFDIEKVSLPTESSITNFNTSNFNKKDPNVFYLIMDALTSVDRLENDLGVEVRPFLGKMNSLNFTTINKAKSMHNQTDGSLGDIFNLGHYSESTRYHSFPYVVREKKSSLLDSLENLGYNFTYSGNHWIDCNKLNVYCIMKKSAWDLSDIFADYSLSAFLQGSAIYEISISLKHYWDRSLDKDIAIQNFYGHQKVNKRILGNNTFHFIHTEIPHRPYRYENCERIHAKDNLWEQDNLNKVKDYKSSVLCAFNKVDEYISKLSQEYPDSIFVISGDHGLYFPEIDSPDARHKSKEFFLSYRFPKICEPIEKENPAHADVVLSVLKCIKRIKASN